MTIERLKSFTANKCDADELVALSAFAGLLQEEYAHQDMQTPEWLLSTKSEISRELRARNKDEVQRKLVAAKAKLETLKSPTEKRRETEREIQRLEAMAGA